MGNERQAQYKWLSLDRIGERKVDIRVTSIWWLEETRLSGLAPSEQLPSVSYLIVVFHYFPCNTTLLESYSQSLINNSSSIIQ
jgi:hypothetical protein